jgi:hypothetical protein
MDSSYFIGFIQEFAYMLIVFSIFFALAMWRGRYFLINIILSLYIAFLILLTFPFFDSLLTDGQPTENAIIKIILFVATAGLVSRLFRRHIPGDDYEKMFGGLWKKVLLSALATILIMIFSYHALPVTELIHPGTPIQALFAPQEYFFWWLILPLALLFVV